MSRKKRTSPCASGRIEHVLQHDASRGPKIPNARASPTSSSNVSTSPSRLESRPSPSVRSNARREGTPRGGSPRRTRDPSRNPSPRDAPPFGSPLDGRRRRIPTIATAPVDARSNADPYPRRGAGRRRERAGDVRGGAPAEIHPHAHDVHPHGIEPEVFPPSLPRVGAGGVSSGRSPAKKRKKPISAAPSAKGVAGAVDAGAWTER